MKPNSRKKPQTEMEKKIPERLCRACQSPVPEKAILCKECMSYQNVRRYLHFSSSVLSLVVALLAVAGIVVPVLHKTLRVERSDIQVNLLSVAMEFHVGEPTDDKYRLYHLRVTPRILLSNGGTLPGVVTDVAMVLEDEKKTPLHVMHFPLGQADYTITSKSVQTVSLFCDYALHDLSKITSLTREYLHYDEWGKKMKSYANPVAVFKASRAILKVTICGVDGGRKVALLDISGHVVMYPVLAVEQGGKLGFTLRSTKSP